MACSQTLRGIYRNCLPNAGGVRAVYLANRSMVSGMNVTTDGEIDSITMEEDSFFYEYQFARGTASLSSNYQVNAENGTRYVQSDLVLVFNRMDAEKRAELLKLVTGEVVAIVEDNNGIRWYLGIDRPLELTAGDGLTGTAYGDRNGYSITLTDISGQMPNELTADWDTIPIA